MSSAIFTQLSLAEISALIRAELEAFFAGNPFDAPMQTDKPLIGGISLAVEVTDLKKPTIYKLVHRREIPHYKRGKKLYFKRLELEAWIEEGWMATVEEIGRKAEARFKQDWKAKN